MNIEFPHPNFSYDPKDSNPGGEGFYIKFSTKGSYSFPTIAPTMVEMAAKKANAKFRRSSTKNGRRGGGTIGLFTEMIQGIEVIDIGVPNLAMHSSRETQFWKDSEDLAKVTKVLYSDFEQIWNDTHPTDV